MIIEFVELIFLCGGEHNVVCTRDHKQIVNHTRITSIGVDNGTDKGKSWLTPTAVSAEIYMNRGQLVELNSFNSFIVIYILGSELLLNQFLFCTL